jgi:DNA-binding CsgD family transcriptional regulator
MELMLTEEVRSVIELTLKQKKLMWMLAEGMTDKEIAASEGVALSTVKNTMVAIYDKLDAKNRAHAVYRFCFEDN